MSTSAHRPRLPLKASALTTLIALTFSAPGVAHAADDPVIMAVSAQLVGLSYRLIDLDGADGVAPSITFKGVTNLSIFDQTYDPQTYEWVPNGPTYSDSLLPSSPLHHENDHGVADATPSLLSVGSSLSLSQLAGVAQADSSGVFLSGAFYFPTAPAIGTSESVGYFTNNTFSLSANTAVVFSGEAVVNFRLDGRSINSWLTSAGHDGASWGFYPGYRSNSIQLILSSMEGGPYNEDGPIATSERRSSQSAFDIPIGSISSDAPLAEGSNTSPFNLQFVNLSPTTLTGQYDIEVQAAAVGAFYALIGTIPSPNPVPEPATFALMGLGLVGIGLVRQRRRPGHPGR